MRTVPASIEPHVRRPSTNRPARIARSPCRAKNISERAMCSGRIRTGFRIAPRMPLMSRRSLAIRSRMRRRSVSILVSPGPRVADPAAAAAGATAGLPRHRLAPAAQPRQHVLHLGVGDTCALPSRLVACWAKMSRISAVRSMTLTFTTFSSAFSCAGAQLAVADDGVGAGGQHHLAQLLRLARADVGRRVGLVAALDQAFEHLGAGGLGERGELGEAGVGVGGAAVGPDADQHDAFEAQLAVLDLGDVGEFGRQTGHAAQCRAVFEGEFTRARGCLLGIG